jgi:predicted alpha/beta-hydrolase family hydrolase
MLTLYRAAPPTGPAAALVLAHGAGAGQASPFMVRVAKGLAARGICTATFDFPYILAKKHMPDKPPVLEDAWRKAIDAAGKDFPGLPLFIGGKSMGGRIATHVAAQGCDGVKGVVLLGYPLHPPGRPQQRRDAHLPSVTEPMLFVQGTRDTFGSAADIAALQPTLKNATVHEVAGGDHSFKTSGKTDTLEPIMDTVAAWIRSRS